MMLQNNDEKETILQELVLRLILCEQYKDALNELELYLPAFPYQDNPVLHTYAGLLSLYLAQESATDKGLDPILLRDAQSHFDQALTLDPDNVVAQEFSQSIPELRKGGRMLVHVPSDDEFEMDLDDELDMHSPKVKRTRT
ncbi:hypothetical protein CC1G_00167 [Coprinopsis cinerea okayama7|uniref:Uncharacterized protein n=1 Tax=Coprinopsis cinerea (strain Okayama-7 / 130 / ATCC MYA-4618 / FGSC 9003) TaxID=240176 RepID=A8NX03_COPC7|nr:hypothetical protein CC1G_00167 [Coprinopsis cinerea okayama7\|eukprot:XP_001837031.1 hypothetical protein CC1G_00167 [Coprinopsis cinerea okayama7\